jgi:hypothetical protein
VTSFSKAQGRRPRTGGRIAFRAAFDRSPVAW